MKDNFSENSNQYRSYRPRYPSEFYDYLEKNLLNFERVWDCGTGNGQVAKELSILFDEVYATDISQPQLDNAFLADNIIYSCQPAEQTFFHENFFDLIVVAQAIHWFDFDLFYHEVKKTLKPEGVFIIIGYNLLKINPELDVVINHFYKKIIGTYWDAERKYIDEAYQTIPFPFKEEFVPKFQYQTNWSLEHLIGYLKTWSAVKHYIKEKGSNPVDLITEELTVKWGDQATREITFPILFRMGKMQ
ncbi:class I SAM-dependent methyltransferase [Chondrinema litorale]|uniref:class I SAM-dependent methyltransferase n=1 Tax=Chondrinema litorale TaxID=2994555 RepID=UPI002543213F|nr:class I SAM-dependent methyltransferase [Chondrinema litorale]UZR97640.1 class I SAM-dependent methyltransferase [Chondrinema litorale]